MLDRKPVAGDVIVWNTGTLIHEYRMTPETMIVEERDRNYILQNYDKIAPERLTLKEGFFPKDSPQVTFKGGGPKRKRLKRVEFQPPGHECCACGRNDRHFASLTDDELHPVCNECQKAESTDDFNKLEPPAYEPQFIVIAPTDEREVRKSLARGAGEGYCLFSTDDL